MFVIVLALQTAGGFLKKLVLWLLVRRCFLVLVGKLLLVLLSGVLRRRGLEEVVLLVVLGASGPLVTVVPRCLAGPIDREE